MKGKVRKKFKIKNKQRKNCMKKKPQDEVTSGGNMRVMGRFYIWDKDSYVREKRNGQQSKNDGPSSLPAFSG